MKLETTNIGSITQIVAEGRLDAEASEPMDLVLGQCVAAGNRNIRIDLKGVPYISSAGLRVLIQGYKKLQGLGGTLVVTHVSRTVEGVLELAGLGSLMQHAVRLEPEAGSEGIHDVVESEWGSYQIFQIKAGATTRLERVGGRGIEPVPEPRQLRMEPRMTAIGIANFAHDEAEMAAQQSGPFLAVAGMAIVRPGKSETARPDYMTVSGALIPEVQVWDGIVAEGETAWQAKIKPHREDGVPLEDILQTVRHRSPGQAVLVVVSGGLIDDAKRLTGIWVGFFEPGDGSSIFVEMNAVFFPFTPPKAIRSTITETLAACLESGNPLSLRVLDGASDFVGTKILGGEVWVSPIANSDGVTAPVTMENRELTESAPGPGE